MPLIKKARRIGNSKAVIIPKPFWEYVGIEDWVKIEVDGNRLIITNADVEEVERYEDKRR